MFIIDADFQLFDWEQVRDAKAFDFTLFDDFFKQFIFAKGTPSDAG